MGTSAKISARVLTVLLGVAAATVLWVGVWPTVLSGSGLDVKSRIGWLNPPMPGPQFEPSVAVEPDRGLRLRWSEPGTVAPETIFPWRDSSNGTVDVATGRPPVRMVGVGLAVAAGGSAVQLLAYAGERDIIARSAAAGILKAAFSFSFSFLPLVVGAVLILLAEIFRQGVRLRTEVDGLI
jgi:hypothetical protein